MKRRHVLLLLLAIYASLGAAYRTQNFLVHAQTPEIAKQVGDLAEHYRREKAVEWLGQEMPPWNQPCPLHVQVSMEGPSGETSFNFGPVGVMSMKMSIQGPLDRLLSSVLPHEITHTVFAHYFRCPVPRWADEGGSVLSEDDIERERHDKLTRNILNNSRQIPMRRLFSLTKYPQEVLCLYAQGYSISDYLVKRSDRRTFLQFVAHGMRTNWDTAVQTFYQHRNVEDLEEAWLKHLRDTKGQPHMLLAQGRRPASPSSEGDRGGIVVRLTAPPAQPLEPAPVVRGAMPGPDQTGQKFGDVRGLPASRQTTAPLTMPIPGQWQPVQPHHAPSAPVQLGPPQFGPLAPSRR